MKIIYKTKKTIDNVEAGDLIISDEEVYTSRGTVQKIVRVAGNRLYINENGWFDRQDSRLPTKEEIERYQKNKLN